MCGIFGIFDKTANLSVEEIAKRISPQLMHRGPDDFGAMFTVGESVRKNKQFDSSQRSSVVMLHYRLSILDLSALGWQPMSCPGNRFHIVFNGEIYNYRELREQLINAGHHFNSQSDTEVLLTAYIEWGKECLQKLIGMFAFAIYDSQRSRLFLARDVFGIKPLYYMSNSSQFVFASEIKAILSLGFRKKINSERAYFYLRHGLTDYGDETLFEDIKQLEAGQYLDVDLREHRPIHPHRYFNFSAQQQTNLSYSGAVEQLREMFIDNVRLHLRSDVAIGAALSGGIDSSSIVMAMRHVDPTLNLQTFSYIAEGSAFNEEHWIDAVNLQSRAVSHKISFSQSDLLSDLQHLINLHDEPFGSTSIYAQHRIFRLAKEKGIKVMLDGQGADELLAGYSFYRAARFASLIKSKKFLHALSFLWQAKQYGGINIVLRSMQYLLPVQLQAKLRPLIHKDYMPAWINKAWFAEHNVNHLLNSSRYNTTVLRDDLVHAVECTSLPMLLRYEDRNSMSYSIESRVPFLTPQLAHFVLSLPEHYLIDSTGRSKAIFRDAMRGIVPDIILNRKDKIGFATPEEQWLKLLHPWITAVLNSDYAKQLPVFNHHKLLKDWNLVRENKSKFDFRIWRWINFIKWSEQHELLY